MLAVADAIHRWVGLADLLAIAGILLAACLVALVVGERLEGRAFALRRLAETLRDDPLVLASALLRQFDVSR
jgi:hypothetical protein